MITVLKKIFKGIVIAIGTLITLVALVAGSLGIYYRKTSIEGYTGLRTSVLNIEQEIKNAANNADDLVNDIFTNGTAKLDDMKSQLEALKQKDLTNSSDIQKIEDVLTDIENNVLSGANKDQIEGYVDQFVSQVNNVSNEIENVANDWTPQKFTETYDDVTISLTAVSATILGVIILTSIIQLALYKKVEGVKVRRSKVKSDLAKHIDKILKKYPNLKENQ